MARGRKTHTYNLPEKSQSTWSTNNTTTARNLRTSELGGVIFGCKHKTMEECFQKELFGLPASHFSYVKKIKPGLPLFLFNYSDRKLHGIFEAATAGQLCIDPHGWTGGSSESTSFAAQVKMRIRKLGQPLPEDQFRPIISENYYRSGLFWFELDHVQTNKLISLFSSSPVALSNYPFRKTEKLNKVSKAPRPSDTKQGSLDVREPTLRLDTAHPVRANAGSSSDSSALGSDSLHLKSTVPASATEEPSQVPLDAKWNSGMSYSSVVQNMSASVDYQNATHIEKATGKQDVLGPKENCDQFDTSVVGDTHTYLPHKKWSSLFGKENTTSNARKFETLERISSEVNAPHSTEWDSKCVTLQTSQEIHVSEPNATADAITWKKNIVDSKENCEPLCSYVAADMSTSYALEKVSRSARQKIEPVREVSLETNSTCNEANMERLHSFVQPFLDEESDSSRSLGGECMVEFPKKNIQCFEDISYPGITNSNQMGCFDSQDVVSKLMQEVEELKFSRLQYFQKIDALEQDLVSSRKEIQQLKDRFRMLELRQAVEIDELVLIVGGSDGTSWLKDLDIYSPLKDSLKPLSQMNSARVQSSAAMLNGELYVFGGDENHVWSNIVESYNPSSNQWFSRPALNQRKGCLAGLSLNEKIFAIGGGNEVECFADMEMFDADIGRWIPCRSMLHKRLSPAATILDGVIYVAGGFDGKDYLKSVERFDPRGHSWARLANMSATRGCHSLAVLNKKIFAVGGYDGSNMASTVEIYDPCMDRWMVGEPLKDSRAYFSSVVIGDAIYVIGGLSDNGEVLDKVECYKEGFGWQKTNSRSIGRRSFFSAVVM